MTGSDVLLTADDARVTVLRSLASSAFGAWVLELPDKIEVDDLYPPSAPGNEPGFVAALPVARGRVGGLARRFVRADVKITVEGDDEDQLGDLAGLGGSTSTVDRVLSEAVERVSGEFFLESDISKAGLNGWTPMVDFEVGDLVWVRVLGRLVRLPVTRIDPVVSEHDVVDWTVHVGGQVVSDDDARLAENDVVRAALVQDRRELAGVVGGLSRRVSRAQSSAEVAQGTADKAVERASGVEEFLSGGGDLVGSLAAINSQLAAHDEPAASGLVPAYLRINAQLWEAQQEIDAVQTTAIADNEARIGEIETLTDELVKTQQELVARRIPVLSDGNDGQYFSRNGTTVTARGEWAGDVQVLEDEVGPRAVRIPNPEGGRTISLTNAGSWVTLLALVSQGVMRRFIGDLSTSLPSASVSWGYVPGSPSFTASMTGEHTIRAKVAWQRAIYFATYGLRIVVGGSVVKTIEQSKIGPLIGHGVRTQTLTATDVMVNAGQKVELQVKADTGEGPAKWVRSLTLDVVWVEGA